MLKKTLATIIMLCAVTVYAQDSEESTRKNWAIQYSFGSGNGQASGFGGSGDALIFPVLFGGSIDPAILALSALDNGMRQTEIYTASFHAEYYPSWFGFVFGISSHQYNIILPPDPIDIFFPLLIFGGLGSGSTDSSGSSPGLGSSIGTLLILTALSDEEKLSLVGSTLDFGMNFHMNRDGMFDPYFGLLAGVGTVGSGSSILKAEAKLGLRANFTESFYMFVEGYVTNHFLEFAIGGGESAKTTISDQGGKLGFGIML